MQTKVGILDAGIKFSPETDKDPAKDQIFVRLENSGETYAKIAGKMTIFNKTGDNWRQIMVINPDIDRGIVPTVQLNILRPSLRRLPSGTYKIDADLSVNGRPLRKFSKIIDYQGDPSVTTVASEVRLNIDPARLEMVIPAGARRSAYVTLQNPSDEALTMKCSVSQPKELQGVAMGNILGDYFSCDKWASASPPSFTLRPGGERKFAVQVAFPKDGTDRPAYYATLRLEAFYPDSQYAGSIEALVVAKNQKMAGSPRLNGSGMSLARDKEDKYSLVASFSNVGDIYLDPSCKGTVTDAAGLNLVQSFDLTREPGLVLPLGTPRFSGEIDFAAVKPGTYVIKAVASYADTTEAQKLKVKVTRGAKYNSVEVIK